MKNIYFSLILLFSVTYNVVAQNLSPYFKVTSNSESIQQNSDKVTKALQDHSFTILGSYSPENNGNLKVIAFTRTDLKNAVVKGTDRGALAAVYKVGLVQENGKTTVSYTNPEYFLHAYLGDKYDANNVLYQSFSSDLKSALSVIGTEFQPFGGSIKSGDLKGYHYKIMMPYFSDPVTLKQFGSFEQGLQTIEANLNAKKGKTMKVFELIYPNEKVAVFGIALLNTEEGEAHFLPKIGEANIAAMPYEIILQGNKATMLHGKYRLAISWPDLTMGTFMRIMSTPGDIEDMLKTVCE